MQQIIDKRASQNRVSAARCWRLSFIVMCSLAWPALAQQSNVDSTSQPAQLQATGTSGQEFGIHISSPETAVEVEGLIRLDVEVVGPVQAVRSLARSDFSVFDDGDPQKIVAFRAPSPQDPVTVILLIDTLGLPSYLSTFERKEVAKFLRQNAGQLNLPVAIYSLANARFSLVASPSRDGNALAADVESDNALAVLLEPRNTSASDTAAVDQTYAKFPLLTALRAIGTIAAAENDHPGRKLLLWVGPGLLDPSISTDGTGQYLGGLYSQDPLRTSDEFMWIMTLMRQARVSLYAFSIGENEKDPNANAWKAILALPRSAEKTSMDLYKKVLAVRTGGRVLPPEQDLAQQISECVTGIGVFYSLTFDPPSTSQNDDYHTLDVAVSDPGVTARTVSGYFDQPFYNPSPDAGLRPATVAELEQSVALPGVPVNVLPSVLRLSERLSDTKLSKLERKLHGSEQRAALRSIADLSAFLPPPVSEIPADPPPDPAGQQKILAAVEDYLDHAIPKLPDFFATRSAVRYGETAGYNELSLSIKPAPMHVEAQSKETVLYRDGKEIVDAAKKSISATDRGLSTYGTFGPLLRMAQNAIQSRSDVSWSRWEQDAAGRIAVFQFHTSTGSPTIRLKASLFPYGAKIASPFRGEIAVDPATGTILRLQTQADLPGFAPVSRSDMMVIYGPVEIDGRRYIVPLRSISVMTVRTVPTLDEWSLGFQTWGPFETRINEFIFDHYHMFHSTSRILPGFTEVPQ